MTLNKKMNAQTIRHFFILLLLAAPGIAAGPADITVSSFKELVDLREGRFPLRNAISTLAAGIGIANDYLATVQNRPLYCLPEDSDLDPKGYVAIVSEQIKHIEATTPAEKIDELPIGPILLNGLMRTYPCKSISAPCK